MSPSSTSWHLFHPRYWPIWLLLVPILVALAALPWFIQQRLGRGLGILIYHLAQQRRNDTEVNIRLCFPEKTAAEQQQMVKETFENGGLALFETANAWIRPIAYYRHKITVHGLEHLQQAQAQGKGVLLLGAHYSFIDLCGTLAKNFFPVDTVYRPQNNKALEWLVRRLRLRVYDYQIDHDNMRLLIRALKENHIVWYTPDQDFGLKQGVFAPFFGIQAATLTATRRLAQIRQSPVLCIHFRRAGWQQQYEMFITPVIENYPSHDEVADATRVNQILETLIKRSPTQYFWFHRRFKTRPQGEKPPYVKKRREIREAAALAKEQTQQENKS